MIRPLRRPTLPLAAALAGLGVLLLACSPPPRTDRDQYPAGAYGRVLLRNTTGLTLWLAGCSHFEYQQQVGDEWVTRDPEKTCVWEGFAEPVEPGATVRDPLDTQREPGIWRVRYPVGLGCAADQPLSEASCAAIFEMVSNPFEIGDEGCVIGGCSGELCGERGDVLVSLCVWLEEFACYGKARCGRFGPGGRCAWEPTPELEACLAEAPPPFTPVQLD